MREILFKGKRVDNGEWVYGMPCATRKSGIYAIQTFDGGIFDIIPESISEFTGLTDKNDKRIFEGDICCFREWSKGKMCWCGEVHYEHQQFVISGNPNEECESPFLLVMSRFISENIEVIGNIHDNPELLGGEDNENTKVY